MKERLTDILLSAIDCARRDGALACDELPPVVLEKPRDVRMGDWACTIAMSLAAKLKRSPRDIANILVARIGEGHDILEKVEIAGPGYINFTLAKDVWRTVLKEVEEQGSDFGRSRTGQGKSVNVEFVSANPTGPMHVGHGRGAAVGDALSRLLEFSGYTVTREFYINDAGRQMNMMGISIYSRYRQILGDDIPFPEGGYGGDYINDIAKKVVEEVGDRYRKASADECLDFFRDFGYRILLAALKSDLSDFGITFDNWFSERGLYERGEIVKALDKLREKGYTYESEDALWLRSTDFGDDKDRVLRKGDGEYTYLAPDIAYHLNKLECGYDMLVNLWGADHHGYIPRMQAAIQAFGHPRETLKVVLVQMVALLRGGQPVVMSKRAGEFVTLREVMDEVGPDAARFFFLMRRSDSHLDFDLELAKQQNSENPVYYVQYAHARLAGVLRQAVERGIAVPRASEADLTLLNLPSEIELLKELDHFPDLVEGAALALEPHRITFYLQGLAGSLHKYYFENRIMGDEPELTRSRLVLIKGVKTVLGNGLRLLGVTAPDLM